MLLQPLRVLHQLQHMGLALLWGQHAELLLPHRAQPLQRGLLQHDQLLSLHLRGLILQGAVMLHWMLPVHTPASQRQSKGTNSLLPVIA